MNITEQAATVLAEIDAELALADKATAGPWTETGLWLNASMPFESNDRTFIASARTVCPTALRCLKTAIEGLLYLSEYSEQSDECGCYKYASEKLTTLITQWSYK